MENIDPQVRVTVIQSRRADLAMFIAGQTTDLNFKLHDWLRTLQTEDLQRIEEDAQNCYCRVAPGTLSEEQAADLVEAALMAYVAETSFAVTQEEALDCLEDLLVGLSVAACVERLGRAGWVTITGRMGILMGDPRPYRVTHKGMLEGVWSDQPLTLWLLGMSLAHH